LRLADGLADHRQERYEVVAGTGLDLLDTLSVEARCPDTRKGLRRDSADGTPGFGGEYLDLQPELEAMAVGPDLADPRRCVTLDQVGAELLEIVGGDTRPPHYKWPGLGHMLGRGRSSPTTCRSAPMLKRCPARR